MSAKQRIFQVFAILFAAGLLAALIAPFATRAMRAAASAYYVSPTGDDSSDGRSSGAPFRTIQKAVDLAQPGSTINLALVGFTIDGLWGSPSSASGYRDKLLYVLGKQPRDGVSGLRVFKMTFVNAGGECIRLRYFAQHNEIAGSSISNCGVHDFRFAAGGKNGEGIYIGTAPEQRGDGKNPTSDPDLSNQNWIHQNHFDTQGNECVDIKESATGNIVEDNTCTGQRDPESGGFDSRGSGNIFRANQSYANAGAGIRLGGDAAGDGIGNHVYGNIIRDNQAGGIKAQRQPQGQVCGNTLTNNSGGDSVGSYGDSLRPSAPCSDTPVPTAMPAPTSAPPAPTTTPVPTSASQPAATALPAPTSPPAPDTAGAGGCPLRYELDGGVASVLEAEQYSARNGRFVEVLDASRSGGVAMSIPGSGMRKDRATYLTYSLEVRNGGKFYIWLLGYGPDDSADSFSVQIDNGKTRVVSLPRAGWGWKRTGGTLTLADGAHTLYLKNREDGASVDRLLLTRDKHDTPAGPGGVALAPQC
jgi:hypothetical protein